MSFFDVWQPWLFFRGVLLFYNKLSDNTAITQRIALFEEQPPADISLSSLSPLPPHAGGVFFCAHIAGCLCYNARHEGIH
jgi:hypothetical protein